MGHGKRTRVYGILIYRCNSTMRTVMGKIEKYMKKNLYLFDCICSGHVYKVLATFCRPERHAKRMKNTHNQVIKPSHALQRGSFNLRRQHKCGTLSLTKSVVELQLSSFSKRTQEFEIVVTMCGDSFVTVCDSVERDV